MGDADRSSMLWPPLRKWTPQLAARLHLRTGVDDPETMEGQRNFAPPRDADACPDWPTRPFCYIGDRFRRMRGSHFQSVYEFIDTRIQVQRDWLVRALPHARVAPLLLRCACACAGSALSLLHRIAAVLTPPACMCIAVAVRFPLLLPFYVRTTRTLRACALPASSSAACTRPRRCAEWRASRKSCACASSRRVCARACVIACA
jgi:hypothetical protein